MINLKEVWIEIDSMFAANFVLHGFHFSYPYSGLLDYGQALLMRCSWNVKISHVLCEANSVAEVTPFFARVGVL